MQWSQQLQIVHRSLSQQKLRTLLSMLGVIFGVISVTTMFSVGEGAKEKILKQIEQLGIHNIILKTVKLTEAQKIHAQEHLSYGISAGDLQKIKANVPFIQTIAPIKEVKASVTGISEELYPEVIAVTPEFRAAENISLSGGRFISDLDQTQRNLVCVLGAEISRRLGPGGETGKYIRIETEMFRIIGILTTRAFDSENNPVINVRDLNRVILIPLNTTGYVEPGTLSEIYSEVKLKVQDKTRIMAAARQIKAIMERAHRNAEDYQVVVPLELLNKQKQAQNNFSIFLGTIAFISLLVGGIGIMNIMLANVSERTREIGIRRAIGANQDHVKIQFLLEAVSISVTGGIVGLIIGLVITLLISVLGNWNIVIKWWFIVFSVGMATAVGILSGLYPAVKASQMDPIQALRNE
jgi:putative ABC transport system permease protein